MLIGWSGLLVTNIFRSTCSTASAAAKHRIKSETSPLLLYSSRASRTIASGCGNASCQNQGTCLGPTAGNPQANINTMIAHWSSYAPQW